MTDIDDFDLDRSTAQAWSEFQARLAEVISVIDESEDLTIGAESDRDAQPYLTLTNPRRDVVRCEAAGNAVLGKDFQLGPEQRAAMESLGWQPPAAGEQPEPNFWIERPQEESEEVAELAVAALRDVYGVQHPVFLAPNQLAEVLNPRPAPLRPPAVRDGSSGVFPGSQEHLNQLVDGELTDLYGHPPIRDSEGDVAIRVGSTMVFLRTTPDAREVIIFAAVVHDIAGRSRAAEVLNDLNVEARWVKFQLIRDRVFVSISLLARPFVPAHLREAVGIMSAVADGIDEELAKKLNGRTTFTESGGTPPD